MKNYQNVPNLNLNWKDFKNWLEKNIIEYEELTVKIRPEKQDRYGELSTNALTNFFDSLEATLDNDKSYHLFPHLEEGRSFRQMFFFFYCFGKKTNQEKLSERDYNLLERLFTDWKNFEKARNLIELKSEERFPEKEEEKCLVENCLKEMFLPSIYCFDHTCQAENCLKLRMNGEIEEFKIYCQDHFQQSIKENFEIGNKSKIGFEFDKELLCEIFFGKSLNWFESVEKENQKLKQSSKDFQAQLDQLTREKIELKSKIKEFEVKIQDVSIEKSEKEKAEKSKNEAWELVERIAKKMREKQNKMEQERIEHACFQEKVTREISCLKASEKTTENINLSQKAVIESNWLIIDEFKSRLENQKREIEKLTNELKKSQKQTNFFQEQIQKLEEKTEITKWDSIRINIGKEEDISRLVDGGYWDEQIQVLHNDRLPLNKRQIALQTGRRNHYARLKAKLENKQEQHQQTQIIQQQPFRMLGSSKK